jgi:peptidyl-prolyl cis-trans isomerase D
MLDVMRKHSRSFIIYIFFGIIIAVFIVNFGPQSAGCTATVSHAARVEGTAITQTLFNYAMAVSGYRDRNIPERQMVQLRAMVMDRLLVRELLANDALDLGFRITDKEIDDMIVKGRFLSLGYPQPLMRSDEGKFDYDLLSRWVRYSFNLTVAKFKEEQRRELLADKLRRYLRSMVKVSEAEVQDDFLVKNTQIQLAYVRFSAGDARGKILYDEAKLLAFAASNKAKIAEYYKDNKAAFQKLPKQVRLQAILIKAGDRSAGRGSAAPDPAAAAPLRAAARKRAEALRKRIEGGEPFGKVAAAESDDAESRGTGGVLGWRNEDSPGFDGAVNKAVAKLTKDQLSPVLEGKDSFHLLRVIGRRQGDLTLQQAELDIAEDLYRTDESLRGARAEAAAFIKRARGGEKLEQMFTPEDEKKEDDASSQPASQAASQPASQPAAGAKGRSPLKLQTTNMFSRSGRGLIPGIGLSKELQAAAFKLKKGEVAGPFVVGQQVFLVQLVDRKDADLKEWSSRKEDLIEQFTNVKAGRLLGEYAHRRCEQALKNKSLSVNSKALITPGYQPDKKEGPLPTFAPCSSLEERGQQP